MVNKVMETWLNLMTEASRGNNEARETMRSITGTSLRPDEVLRMMTRFMPPGIGPVQPEVFNEWLEEYWKTIGVVPRYRYLELLERHEDLRRRVEEMERMNRKLQPMLSMPEQQEEAKKMLGLWGSMMEQALKAQESMMEQTLKVQQGMLKSGQGESDDAEATGAASSESAAADASESKAADTEASKSKRSSKKSSSSKE